MPSNLGLEDAWNYGVNYYHIFHINEDQVITLSFDAYRTHFNNQLIVDLDQNANAAHFYMSKEKSYANNLQLESKIDVLDDNRWVLTLAGRYNDSRQTTNNKLQDKIYVSKWKFLMVNNLTFNYKWFFDLTSQYNGKVRLPNTAGAREDYSKAYPMFFTQITRRFRHVDVYVGCENIFNTVQKNPIIDHENPFGTNFDATVIYGSLMPRMVYIGARITL
jgi:hypothetical protein